MPLRRLSLCSYFCYKESRNGANAKKPKAKARPKLNPTENAALKRLEHDLINEDGIVPATKAATPLHCLTVIGTIEGHTLFA